MSWGLGLQHIFWGTQFSPQQLFYRCLVILCRPAGDLQRGGTPEALMHLCPPPRCWSAGVSLRGPLRS